MVKNSIKILIIGSKGMLGQELMRVFGDKRQETESAEIIGWDRGEIDVANEVEVNQKIKDLKPDIIINAAAYNAVDKCEEEEGFAIAKKINGEAPGYLAKIAKELEIILVHYSTDYVFAGDKKEGYKEDDAPSPISKYGESKLLGEENVRKFGEKYYLLRTCKLFGRPAISEAAKKSFVDIMLNLAGKQDTIEAVDEGYASPTYAPDLAQRTREIVDGHYPWGIYHVTNSGACTWYEFAKEIFKIKNIKINLIPVGGDKFPRPARRPKFSPLINTKLPLMRSWQEALKEYLKLD
jgi:dTDP-4-dehydrorhamnose reductase